MVNAKQLLPDPGESSEAASAAWLLAFIKLDVPSLSSHDLHDVLVDVRTLARLQLADQKSSRLRWKIVPEAVQTDPPGEYCLPVRYLRMILGAYQTVIRKAMVELAERGRTVFSIQPLKELLKFEITNRNAHPTFVLAEDTIEEVLIAFDFRLLLLLHDCASILGVCRRSACAQMFVRDQRSDKNYCSKRCSTFERVRRWREKQKQTKSKKKTKGGKHERQGRTGKKEK